MQRPRLYWGFDFDTEKNKNLRGTDVLSTESSKVKVIAVETNEELVIAQDTYKIISQLS